MKTEKEVRILLRKLEKVDGPAAKSARETLNWVLEVYNGE